MHDFFHDNQDDYSELKERFERMLRGEKLQYFDIHEVEHLYNYYMEFGHHHLAEKLLVAGMKLHPGAIALKLKKASLLIDKGMMEEAIELLDELSRLDSGNPELYINMGWANLRMENTDAAMKYFETAVAHSANDEKEDVLLEIGLNLNQLELYSDALFFLQRCYDINPDNESCLFEMAYAFDKTNKNLKGIDIYSRLLNLNPYLESAWYNLGILYNKEDRFSEALDAYNFALTIDHDYTEAYFNKGNTYVNMGLFQEALDAYFEHASYRIDPAQTYQYIGDCWEQLGNAGFASRFFKLSIELDPTNADAYYGYGTTLIALGQNEDAVEMLMHAANNNPHNPDYLFALAQAYLELKDFKACASSLELGLNLAPEEILAWIELLKINVLHNPEFSFDSFIKKAWKDYGRTNSALLYLDAYHCYYFEQNLSKTKQKLNKAYNSNPQMLDELHEEAQAMLNDKLLNEVGTRSTFKTKTQKR